MSMTTSKRHFVLSVPLAQTNTVYSVYLLLLPLPLLLRLLCCRCSFLLLSPLRGPAWTDVLPLGSVLSTERFVALAAPGLSTTPFRSLADRRVTPRPCRTRLDLQQWEEARKRNNAAVANSRKRQKHRVQQQQEQWRRLSGRRSALLDVIAALQVDVSFLNRVMQVGITTHVHTFLMQQSVPLCLYQTEYPSAAPHLLAHVSLLVRS